MTPYKAPLRDMRFQMNEVFDYPAHYARLPNGADATPDIVDAILEGVAELSEDVLAPLNMSGDREGCHFRDGAVTTPAGFKEAYAQFVAGGWQGLSFPAEYGGQGLPASVSVFKSEMMGTANWSFSMYPGLSVGCINTLLQYGTDAQKAQYLPSLVSGEWAGTMCLTEAHCGTDLGQIRTRAEPQADGSYRVTGTKVFISSGEHDLAENIIHIVLARLPGAPAGTRGISLFIVPKVIVNADGSLGERNAVTCGSIEHKMGIRASATAVLNFEGATASHDRRAEQGARSHVHVHEHGPHRHRDTRHRARRGVVSMRAALCAGAALDARAVRQEGTRARGRCADLASRRAPDAADAEGHRGRRPRHDLQRGAAGRPGLQRATRKANPPGTKSWRTRSASTRRSSRAS